MKALAGVVMVLAALVLLALGAAALLLPGVVASDAVRARIEASAQAALGRALRYERLDFGWLPPSLRVIAPAIAGDTPDAPLLAEARSVSLRVALLPLFARTLVVDGLVVDGGALRLRRTAAGLELPRPPERAGTAGSGSPIGAADGTPPLAVRLLELRDTTLILEDEAITPPVSWELRDLQANLRGKSLEEPVRLDASFRLASGGSVSAHGTVTVAGDVDLDFDLDEVALAQAAFYLSGFSRFTGNVSGVVELEGQARSPNRVAARLAVQDADIKSDEFELRGPLRVDADLAGGRDAPNGRFDIDATDAELVFGGAFHKPPGTPASVKGRIVSGKGGVLGFDDLELKVHNLDATAELETGRRTRMNLRAPAFDLAGWEALLPALEGWQLGGRMTLDGLVLERDPAGLLGRIDLAGVQATSPHGGRLVLDGALLGEGPRMHSEGLALSAAEQPFRVDVEIVDLGTPAPRWHLNFDTRDVDAHRILDGFTRKGGVLHGRLTGDGDLHLPVGAGEELLSSLRGRLRFEIRDGWTSGRSLLKTSLDALIAVARPLELLSRGYRRGDHASSKDRFESVSGTFDIADGVARTQDLRIVEREHSIDLNGTLRLADLGLDMHGRLSFADQPGGGRGGIPIARVQGTLGDPQVEVSSEAARSFAAALKPSRLGAKLERTIGPKGVRKLADGLGNLLDRAKPEHP